VTGDTVKTRSGMATIMAIALIPFGIAAAAVTPAGDGVSMSAASAGANTAKKDDPDKYKDRAAKARENREKRITQEDRDLAAARALQDGALNPLMVDMVAAAIPGEMPRYFSHPNYANSPLPTVTTTAGAEIQVGNELIERGYATDNASNVFVVLPDALPDGFLTAFKSLNQAGAGGSTQPSAGLSFHAYVLRPTGTANQFTVEFDSGQLTVPALTDPAVSEVVSYLVANLAVQAGDQIAFYGRGIPLDIGTASDLVAYPANTAPLQGSTITIGSAAFPELPQDRTYSFAATVVGPDQVTITGGMRKFVDELPRFGTDIPVAVADTTSYPGSNYYEIALVEYEQQLHADLPPTKLRGYVQLDTAVIPGDGVDLGNGYRGVTAPSYLGPAITTDKDVPVRILFRNLLPTGVGGNLFLPVDTTVMGAGMTPSGHQMMEDDPTSVNPQIPMCDPADPMMDSMGHCYTENRAGIHLHGGITPWISDGTPHQWITPAGENIPAENARGVSVRDVPDMPATGPGEQTFFYTNAQSARLMFYHDHAWGITRLNVYAGMVAPYIISDDVEKKLVADGTLPAAADTIPLVIQDKTFVPSVPQMLEQDETWDYSRWGDEGDLWLPHVYSPAQNPGDASGVNAYGRWAYGPWFWPPTSNIDYGPIDNAYYDPNCDPDVQWCEPPLAPGVPYNSMGMEAFMDTPLVNGKAYPTVTLEPKPYRLRILNGANDRFFNLSLYQAVDANGVACDAANPTPAAESTGIACTEVALNPDEVAAALEDSTVFPPPVAGTEGPDWIVVGTEGGFLPTPAVVPAHPTTWVNDPTVFNAGNVDQHSLLIAPAERFDVVVDLSAYAGQTLIVYNDAPAAFPARDPRYDYYTGNGDYRDSGGVASTLPGYGPNTRTMMQIKVEGTPAAAFDMAKLNAAFAHQADGTGVFEAGQKPIIVGQGAYNSAYGTSFQNNGPLNGTVQIYDTSLTFDRLVDPDAATAPGAPFTTSTDAERLTINLKPKMIQDEMGEAFEREYGRMSGFLGVETANAQAGLQNMILMGFTFPPTEIIDGVELEPGMEATPIASADDGTQIWKITHNGVDTHPIHFHLYDVQLINRVGWDGIIRKPEATEIGWKDTVRVSPLEDTIVALRPIIPPIPQGWKDDGGLPNSIRLLDPSMPEGMYIENTTAQEALGLPIFAFNPDGEPVDIVNHFVNFGWEYVLHCHILSHEEMDMMHTQVVGIAPKAPTFVSAVRGGSGNNRYYTVTWEDNSRNETAFVIERRLAGSTDPWMAVATVASETLGALGYTPGTGDSLGTRTYQDPLGRDRTTIYEYQVYAINVVGDVWDYSNPAFNEIPAGGGFPTLTIDSRGTTVSPQTVAAPTDLAGTLQVKNRKTSTVNLTWTDNSDNETGFLIQRTNPDGTTTNATVGAGITTFTQTVTSGVSYSYRVHAFSDTAQSDWSNTIRLP